MPEQQKPPDRLIPADDTLYSTDNGRLLCGRHLGVAAAYTGKDISGQEIVEVDEVERLMWKQYDLGEPQCETCKAIAAKEAATDA